MSVFSNLPERESFVCSKREPVFIFGTGSFGRSVARACSANGIEVRAFIQTTPTAHSVDGIALRSWADVSESEKDLPLLIGIFNRDTPFDRLLALVSNAGFHRIALPYDLYAQFGDILGWRYWLASPTFLRDYVSRLEAVHNSLSDEVSRQCLLRVVAFRSGLDVSYASFKHHELQYFNSLSLSRFKGSPINYLDGGAYDGDSFVQLCGIQAVSNAWLFEPDSENFCALTRNATEFKAPTNCLPLGLSDNHGFIRFEAGMGEAGHIHADGNTGITVAAADQLLRNQRVDFIKLDLEGAELPALRGLAQTLYRYEPNVAVSCYHHPKDLWEIPEYFSSMATHKLFFRQHGYSSFDLVLYVIKST